MAIFYKGNQITSVAVSTSGGTSGGGGQAVYQYARFSSFPTTASTKAIYIDLSTSQAYYWNGASYVLIENQEGLDISNLVKLEGIEYTPNEQGDEIKFASASDDVSFTIENSTNSHKLNGQTADYYAKASDVENIITDIAVNQDDLNADEIVITRNNVDESSFYIQNSQNSFKLGGQEPSYYAKASDIETLRNEINNGSGGSSTGSNANVNYSNLVGQETSNKWSGTIVPNDSNVEKVYFNTSLNIDEILSILSSLTYYQTPFISNPIYPILFTTSGRVIFVEKSSNGNYTIINAGNVADQTSGTIIFASKINNEKIEIASFDISECNINENVINDYSGIPIGAENDKITSLVSTTPFTRDNQTTLYQLNNDGSLNKNKPINIGASANKIYLDLECEEITSGVSINLSLINQLLELINSNQIENSVVRLVESNSNKSYNLDFCYHNKNNNKVEIRWQNGDVVVNFEFILKDNGNFGELQSKIYRLNQYTKQQIDTQISYCAPSNHNHDNKYAQRYHYHDNLYANKQDYEKTIGIIEKLKNTITSLNKKIISLENHLGLTPSNAVYGVDKDGSSVEIYAIDKEGITTRVTYMEE